MADVAVEAAQDLDAEVAGGVFVVGQAGGFEVAQVSVGVVGDGGAVPDAGDDGGHVP